MRSKKNKTNATFQSTVIAFSVAQQPWEIHMQDNYNFLPIYIDRFLSDNGKTAHLKLHVLANTTVCISCLSFQVNSSILY